MFHYCTTPLQWGTFLISAAISYYSVKVEEKYAGLPEVSFELGK